MNAFRTPYPLLLAWYYYAEMELTNDSLEDSYARKLQASLRIYDAKHAFHINLNVNLRNPAPSIECWKSNLNIEYD